MTAYVVDLCCENDPTMLWYNQYKMREHLVECLQEKKMRPFPSRVCRPSKPLTISFAVYCVCRLTDLEDENDSMARCENCHQWYHQSCEDIPPRCFCVLCTLSVIVSASQCIIAVICTVDFNKQLTFCYSSNTVIT